MRARILIVKETSVTEVTVSSSAIRGLLLEGNASEAAEYLGYDFFLDGTVVGGYQVGRKIGFPTANLRVSDPDKLIPCDGVYAVRVCVEGKEYGGMLSIGYRPTWRTDPIAVLRSIYSGLMLIFISSRCVFPLCAAPVLN